MRKQRPLFEVQASDGCPYYVLADSMADAIREAVGVLSKFGHRIISVEELAPYVYVQGESECSDTSGE